MSYLDAGETVGICIECVAQLSNDSSDQHQRKVPAAVRVYGGEQRLLGVQVCWDWRAEREERGTLPSRQRGQHSGALRRAKPAWEDTGARRCCLVGAGSPLERGGSPAAPPQPCSHPTGLPGHWPWVQGHGSPCLVTWTVSCWGLGSGPQAFIQHRPRAHHAHWLCFVPFIVWSCVRMLKHNDKLCHLGPF